MGLFDRFFKHADPDLITFSAPSIGVTLPLPDETLGKGVAVRPEEGRVYAPSDGVIDLMFDTSHAFSLISPDGIELFVHIGVDTASLGGELFKAIRTTDDNVKKGDLLVEFDLDGLLARNIDPTISMYITSDEKVGMLNTITGRKVALGDTVIETRKI